MQLPLGRANGWLAVHVPPPASRAAHALPPHSLPRRVRAPARDGRSAPGRPPDGARPRSALGPREVADRSHGRPAFWMDDCATDVAATTTRWARGAGNARGPKRPGSGTAGECGKTDGQPTKSAGLSRLWWFSGDGPTLRVRLDGRGWRSAFFPPPFPPTRFLTSVPSEDPPGVRHRSLFLCRHTSRRSIRRRMSGSSQVLAGRAPLRIRSSLHSPPHLVGPLWSQACRVPSSTAGTAVVLRKSFSSTEITFVKIPELATKFR